MARYLVIGGCGFIGSHLCDALVAAGHRVLILDNLSTGRALNKNRKAELIVGDLADEKILNRTMRHVDGCFQLAAVASIERCHNDWIESHRVNMAGMVTILNAARRMRERKHLVPVVYASSAAVYGNSDRLPLKETAEPKPISAYGVDKLGCELHAGIAGRIFGVPTVGLRFFNVYGPRQNFASPYSGVIAIFCDRLRRSQAVTIFGDGKQGRDFVFVDDAVRAMVSAMKIAATSAPIFNVCSGRPANILGLAKTIAQICKVPLKVEFGPARPGDIRRSLGSAAKIRKALQWSAACSLQEGLRRTLDAVQLLG